jgi:energy-coupling factor transport system permease protein
MFNSRAWLVWMVAALMVPMLATNPLYLAIVLLCAALVRASHGTGNAPLPVWRFGLLVIAFSTLYNALLTHFGNTVLLTLPRGLPLVGGPVTLEAALFGAERGWALWTLFAVFAVFNDVLSPYELARLAPRFLRQAGLVVSIMLAFVPQILKSFRQVREAQAIRGHQLRGVRDLTALLVPLLADSLEKAMQLAEAMEARGYGKSQISNAKYQISSRRSRVLMIGGLSGVLLGWMAEAYWRNGVGWALIGVSLLALVLGAYVASSSGPRTTRYRRQGWSARDTLLVVLSLAPFAAVLAVVLLDPAALVFYPYPRVTLPSFDVRLGLCLALLGAPALIRPAARRREMMQSTAAAGK